MHSASKNPKVTVGVLGATPRIFAMFMMVAALEHGGIWGMTLGSPGRFSVVAGRADLCRSVQISVQWTGLVEMYTRSVYWYGRRGQNQELGALVFMWVELA